MASILQWIDMDRYSRSLRVDSGDGVEERFQKAKDTLNALFSVFQY